MGTYYKKLNGLFIIKDKDKVLELINDETFKFDYNIEIEEDILTVTNKYDSIKRNGALEEDLLTKLKDCCYAGEIIGYGEGEFWHHQLNKNNWEYKRIY